MQKALDILDELASGGSPSRLSALARRIGLPKTTVHRILHDLVGYRLVIRTDDGYVLGEHLYELAQCAGAVRPRQLRRLVTPFLLDLCRQTDATASLGVLAGRSVWYLDTVYAHRHADVIRQTSEQASAHCTSAGKALLGYRPDIVNALSSARLPGITPATITDVNALRCELADIRRRGVAYSREEYVRGIVGIAAPIYSTDGLPVAAVSVAGRADEIDQLRDSRAVQRTAQAATRLLRDRFAASGR
ncbi:IclR family transcriptional regulator [Saccharopolyspora sp. 5N708]|uniref:IclR family transcriptional regulator n=1 Tax=Saccharopolyspora sp. 5N708 TaxID=3457424 RepID=UPI003FD5AA11